MTEPPVVVDAGPLIALSISRTLGVLEMLFGRVLVPAAVYREVVEQGADRPGARLVAAASYLQPVTVDPPPDPLLVATLGPGEAEVITLGVRLPARLVVLDERRARQIAERVYALKVRGTAGLLVAAKRAGHIPQVRQVMDDMRAGGYYLSDRLVARACREAGE